MLAKHEFPLWLLAIVGTGKNGHLHILLLMQQILAFPVSFVDIGRAFVKFPPLHFGGIPRAKLKAQIILKLNIYG
jgi:hypothetical protein